MEKGCLVYKCRMCGKLNKNTQVPDGLTALISILNDGPIPKSWGPNVLSKTELCNCDGNNIGVADLIGFEKDNSDSTERIMK